MLDLVSSSTNIHFEKRKDFSMNIKSFGMLMKKLQISNIQFHQSNESRFDGNLLAEIEYPFQSFGGSLKLKGKFMTTDATKVSFSQSCTVPNKEEYRP